MSSAASSRYAASRLLASPSLRLPSAAHVRPLSPLVQRGRSVAQSTADCTCSIVDGEHFDQFRLDTLFLHVACVVARPGRLHRLHPARATRGSSTTWTRRTDTTADVEKGVRGYRAIGNARGEPPSRLPGEVSIVEPSPGFVFARELPMERRDRRQHLAGCELGVRLHHLTTLSKSDRGTPATVLGNVVIFRAVGLANACPRTMTR
jgi:hypothetical protein